MTDLHSLEREVIARPLANAPRLAYADAVEARDPDRARLIRAQIEELRILRQHEENTSESLALWRETLRLAERHGDRWRPRFEVPNTEMHWRRGFVGSVRRDARDFLAHGAELFELAPVLHASLRNARGLGPELFSSPLLGRLLSLSVVSARLDDRDAEALAQSPYVEQLVCLDLGKQPHWQRRPRRDRRIHAPAEPPVAGFRGERSAGSHGERRPGLFGCRRPRRIRSQPRRPHPPLRPEAVARLSPRRQYLA